MATIYYALALEIGVPLPEDVPSEPALAPALLDPINPQLYPGDTRIGKDFSSFDAFALVTRLRQFDGNRTVGGGRRGGLVFRSAG